eukprot:356972-Chlamydomonas_euryale.AAC.6
MGGGWGVGTNRALPQPRSQRALRVPPCSSCALQRRHGDGLSHLHTWTRPRPHAMSAHMRLCWHEASPRPVPQPHAMSAHMRLRWHEASPRPVPQPHVMSAHMRLRWHEASPRP